MTGGAFGSLVAQWLKLSDAERTTLLVAGAAAGMSATFAAPIAAILLAVELLLFEWRPRSLVPVAVASVLAGALRVRWLGSGPLFPVTLLSAVHRDQALLVAAPLGILVGFASAGLSRLLYGFEDGFEHLGLLSTVRDSTYCPALAERSPSRRLRQRPKPSSTHISAR